MKILLVDDHDMFRDGLSFFFSKEHPEIEIINAKRHDEAITYLKEGHEVKLVLLDLHLHNLSPYENVKSFSEAFPCLPICIISGEERPELIVSIIKYATLGFIPKVLSNQNFTKALQTVMQGKPYFPEYIKQYQASASQSHPNVLELTDRQIQVLGLIAKGYKNDAIAKELFVSENTIAVHVRTILKILKVSNRTEAGFVAQRFGLL